MSPPRHVPTLAMVQQAEAAYEHTRVHAIYAHSGGEETQALFAELEALGAMGVLAKNLFRAQKCTQRALDQAATVWAHYAMGRKRWALDQLLDQLRVTPPAELPGITYGWVSDLDAGDPERPYALVVTLPTGTVSFRSKILHPGPTLPRAAWDGADMPTIVARILAFVDLVLHPNSMCEAPRAAAVCDTDAHAARTTPPRRPVRRQRRDVARRRPRARVSRETSKR